MKKHTIMLTALLSMLLVLLWLGGIGDANAPKTQGKVNPYFAPKVTGEMLLSQMHQPVVPLQVDGITLKGVLDKNDYRPGDSVLFCMEAINPYDKDKTIEGEILVYQQTFNPIARFVPPPIRTSQLHIAMLAPAKGTARKCQSIQTPAPEKGSPDVKVHPSLAPTFRYFISFQKGAEKEHLMGRFEVKQGDIKTARLTMNGQ